MKAVESNLIDVIWGDERPKRPTNNVTVLDVKYAGETCASKLHRLREEMKKKNAALLVLSALDDIACIICAPVLQKQLSFRDFQPARQRYSLQPGLLCLCNHRLQQCLVCYFSSHRTHIELIVIFQTVPIARAAEECRSARAFDGGGCSTATLSRYCATAEYLPSVDKRWQSESMAACTHRQSGTRRRCQSGE